MPVYSRYPHRHRSALRSILKDDGAGVKDDESTFHQRMCAPSHDEIARLAYSYWQARQGQGGSASEDWFRAEQELRGCRGQR